MRIDWYPSYPHPDVKSIAEELFSLIPIKTQGSNREKRELQLKTLCLQIISALYLNHHKINNGDLVSTYKTPKSISESEPIGNKIPYPFRAYMEVYKALLSYGWIIEKLGEKGKSLTLITPTYRLKAKFNSIGLVWCRQPLKRDDELVILRDVIRDENNNKIKQKVDLPDYPLRQQHLDNIIKINKVILSHCITLDLRDDDLPKVNVKKLDDSRNDPEFDSSLMITNTQLSRIFSRGSVELGGRFYRGWWQSVPSVHRPHIRINGYKTDEVDFSGIGIKILYWMNQSEFKGDDPYDIGLIDWKGKDDPRRGAVKKGVNALINDIDGKFKLQGKLRKDIGLPLKEFKNKVNDVHKSISNLFQTKAGLKAQYIDSCIAEKVMLTMIDNKSIALPIHDSFIVRIGYKYLLLEAMEEACMDILGINISVTEEYIKLPEHFGLSKAEVIDKQLDNIIVNGADLYDEIFNSKTSIMDNYLQSFEGAKHKNIDVT
jgi:hypothetical protein